MPKSRHRKKQKKKSLHRTEKVKHHQVAFKKKMEEEFMKKMEEIQDRDLEIQEVDPTKPLDVSTDIQFDEVKK